jgi:UrcA family protein
MKRSIFLTAAAVLLLSQVHADAAEASPASTVVNYSDLDLNASDGAAALYGRLRLGARVVCGAAPDIRRFRAHDVFQACVRDAMAAAVATVDSQTLSQYAATMSTSMPRS